MAIRGMKIGDDQMAFETLDEMNKQETPPITMRVFEPMMNHKPLQFKYNGTTFVLPLGEDVTKTIEALIKLVNDAVPTNSKYVDDNYKKLAVKFAQEYVKQHFKTDKANAKPTDGKHLTNADRPRIYRINKKEVERLGRD